MAMETALAKGANALRAPESAGARDARAALLRGLRGEDNDRDRLNDAVDTLLNSSMPFNERLLGGGPWQVVYTRGALLWEQSIAPGRAALRGAPVTSSNKGSQDFRPGERTVVNKGQVLGDKLYLTAEGRYEPQGKASSTPVEVRVDVTGGALHAWGRRVPLPIRGAGRVTIAYLDEAVRVFRNPGGAVAVQVREDALPRLLGRQ